MYPGESPLDSNPLMWLLLIVVVILFIWFWSSLEPGARKIMSWFILFCCVGVAVLVVASQATH